MKMVIGDAKTTGVTDKWVDVINPATEQVHAKVPDAGVADVDQAVKAARRAFDDGPWSQMTPSERGSLMFKLADLLKKHSDELALMDTSEEMIIPLA